MLRSFTMLHSSGRAVPIFGGSRLFSGIQNGSQRSKELCRGWCYGRILPLYLGYNDTRVSYTFAHETRRAS